MALIICAECGKEISDSAISCPHCGYIPSHKIKEKTKKSQMMQGIIDIAFMSIGLILLVTAFPSLVGYGASYWNNELWFTDEKTLSAVIRLALGAGFFIGSMISTILPIFKKCKKK